jgi:acyl-CoA synthetase (AMP-forming)/AMP-acid ligase II
MYLEGKDISYCINHSESKLFIIDDALYDLTKDVLGELPTVKALIWSDDMAGAGPPDGRFKEFKAWYKAYPATDPDTLLRIEDPCQMTYTSGTESLPKGVIISNQALIAQYMGCIIDGGYDATDINVSALPNLSSLKKCYYGASIMPVEVLKEMLERLPGAKIYNYYGQTELAPYHTILKAADAMAKPVVKTLPPEKWRKRSIGTKE